MFRAPRFLPVSGRAQDLPVTWRASRAPQGGGPAPSSPSSRDGLVHCQGGKPRVNAGGSHDQPSSPGRHTGGMAPRRDIAAGGERPSPGDWREVESASLAEVVLGVLRAQRKAPLATAAAIVRERHEEGFLVSVRLLEGT